MFFLTKSSNGHEKISGRAKLHAQQAGTWLQSTFAWCCFVLGWVLMCRVATTASILLSLMRWTGDCIRIDTAQSKSDKTGEKEKEFGRHIYASPWMPWVCPFLSLGVYIFSQGFRNEDGGYVRLFSGESQEDRYSKILQSVVENVPAEILK